jgi:hypothetical protein
MLRRNGTAAAVALCLLGPLLAPPAPALASGAQVLKDCVQGNGRLSKSYSQKDYQQALKDMPTDLREYSDCEDIIRRAMLGQQVPGTGTSQNPFAGAAPQEVAQAKADIAAARRTGGRAQRVGVRLVKPGALAYRKVTAAVSDLPTPLLVVVVLILLGTGLMAGRLVQTRRERAGRNGS